MLPLGDWGLSFSPDTLKRKPIRPRQPPRRADPTKTAIGPLLPPNVVSPYESLLVQLRTGRPGGPSQVFNPFQAALARRAQQATPITPADLRAQAGVVRETGRARVMSEQAALRAELGIGKGTTRGRLEAMSRLQEEAEISGTRGVSRGRAEAQKRLREEAARIAGRRSPQTARLASAF